MPAPTLDATAGGAAANVYVDAAGATAILAARLYTDAWDDADADTRARALLTATALLDEREWIGYKASTAQALKWPRTCVQDEDRRLVSSAAIPPFIATATALLALALLSEAAVAAQQSTAQSTANALGAFESVKVGPIELQTRTESSSSQSASTSSSTAGNGDVVAGPRVVLPVDVLRLVRRYLAGGGQARVARA